MNASQVTLLQAVQNKLLVCHGCLDYHIVHKLTTFFLITRIAFSSPIPVARPATRCNITRLLSLVLLV